MFLLSFSGCNVDITLAELLSHRVGLQDAGTPVDDNRKLSPWQLKVFRWYQMVSPAETKSRDCTKVGFVSWCALRTDFKSLFAKSTRPHTSSYTTWYFTYTIGACIGPKSWIGNALNCFGEQRGWNRNLFFDNIQRLYLVEWPGPGT